MSGRYVALLRGVNVGGNNKLPMKALAELFVEAGCTGVSTYIQSGNVIFGADAKVAAKLSEQIHAEIAKRFEIHSPVVIRSARELQAVVEGNPFLAEGAPETALHVMFLADKPAAAAVRTLEPERSPGDRFEVRGKDVFLFLPNGVARTKLSNAYFDARLKTVSTGRNWRTVLKLHALVSG